jgi:hypothetical protein
MPMRHLPQAPTPGRLRPLHASSLGPGLFHLCLPPRRALPGCESAPVSVGVHPQFVVECVDVEYTIDGVVRVAFRRLLEGLCRRRRHWASDLAAVGWSDDGRSWFGRTLAVLGYAA